MPLRMRTPTKLYLQLTNRCNLNCAHCYTRCNGEGQEELSTEEWKQFIDYLVNHGVIQVHIEGGEPLMRPDFFELTAYASERMLVWWRTNGTLVDASVAARLRATNVAMTVVDLFAADEDTHDALSGAPGTFEAACAGVQHLRAEGMNVVMACIVSHLTVGQLARYVELAQSLDVNKVALLRLYPIGRARERWSELSVSLTDTMNALRALKVPEGMKVMRSWHPNDGNCCWENAGVTSDGRSIGCPYQREYVDYGNIRDVEFLETWRHPFYRKLRTDTVADACPDCAANESTLGGCRSTAYAFTGDWNAPDPFCEATNHGIDLTVLAPHLSEDRMPQLSATPEHNHAPHGVSAESGA